MSFPKISLQKPELYCTVGVIEQSFFFLAFLVSHVLIIQRQFIKISYALEVEGKSRDHVSLKFPVSHLTITGGDE